MCRFFINEHWLGWWYSREVFLYKISRFYCNLRITIVVSCLQNSDVLIFLMLEIVCIIWTNLKSTNPPNLLLLLEWRLQIDHANMWLISIHNHSQKKLRDSKLMAREVFWTNLTFQSLVISEICQTQSNQY